MNMFFKKFDKGDKGYIESTQIASILKIMGVQFNTAQLRQLITEFDDDGEFSNYFYSNPTAYCRQRYVRV